jgi:hypothetical protein
MYLSCSEEKQEKEDNNSLSNVAHANYSLCLQSQTGTQIGNVHSHIQPITLWQRVPDYWFLLLRICILHR